MWSKEVKNQCQPATLCSVLNEWIGLRNYTGPVYMHTQFIFRNLLCCRNCTSVAVSMRLRLRAVASLKDAEGHQLLAEGHRGLERQRRENRSAEGAEGWGVWGGYSPYPENFWLFYFRIVHSGAFSCTNSKVLLAIKCRERYMYILDVHVRHHHTVFLSTDNDTAMKTSTCHQSRKLVYIQQ